jgi:tRNA(Ile)-lysidine synthase
LDDVAETFVMRLARESGADGLARMASDFMRNDVRFLRPMLSIPREELRQFLKQHKIDWVEDPSNDNEDFDRVRVRRALAVFKDLGISAENLAAVSENMSQVREVLKTQVQSIGKQIVEQDRGDLVIDRAGFLDLHFELRRRLLNDALSWISPVSYPLRRNVISDLNEAIEAQRTFSCNGCLIQSSAKEIRMLREFNAVRELVEFAPAWDRWVLEGPWTMGLKVTALGEPALAGVENWRASGLSRQSLMASPAVWKGDTLVAAPLAGVGEGWTVRIRAQDFHSFMTGSAYSH